MHWALQDGNTAEESQQKHIIPDSGAAKDAANQVRVVPKQNSDDSFSAALAMIAELPLMPAEKAEAVRQLLNNVNANGEP